MIVAAQANQRTAVEELLESDARYFELAAQKRGLPGATLAWMPTFQALPAACVVQRVQSSVVENDPTAWLADVERGLRDIHVPLARLYLTEACSALETLLRQRGYQRRVEIGFVGPARECAVDGVRLVPVESPADWRRKRRLHTEIQRGPDGYHSPAGLWTQLVQSKCATQRKLSFLVQLEGHDAGSVGAMLLPGLLRIKNVVIHPSFRRQGIARRAIEQLRTLAIMSGKPVVGVFGIEGEMGCQVYESCGLPPVVEQVEWSRPLASNGEVKSG